MLTTVLRCVLLNQTDSLSGPVTCLQRQLYLILHILYYIYNIKLTLKIKLLNLFHRQCVDLAYFTNDVLTVQWGGGGGVRGGGLG